MSVTDINRTFQGQIPDLPFGLSLFELALIAADAFFNDAIMYKQAEKTGRFPPALAWRYVSDKTRIFPAGYCDARAEECRTKSGELQQWALLVGVDGWDWDNTYDEHVDGVQTASDVSHDQPDECVLAEVGAAGVDNPAPMGSMAEAMAAYYAGPAYARAQQLLQELGSRTDLDRVLFKANTADVVLAEQDATVGDYDGGAIIEVTGTRGVRVAKVAEAYFDQAAYIIPDWHVSITWNELSKMQRRSKARAAKTTMTGANA